MNWYHLGALASLVVAGVLFTIARIRLVRTRQWLRVEGEIVDVVRTATDDDDETGRPVFSYPTPDGQRRLWQCPMSKSGRHRAPRVGQTFELRVDPTDYNRVTSPEWDGENFHLLSFGAAFVIFSIVLASRA